MTDIKAVITHMRKPVHSGQESGFTLIELLAVVTLTAILMTLGASAVRRFWFVQSLSGAQNELVTQLRDQQQEARTINPKVYGARFWFGSSDWELISYDPSKIGVGEQCEQHVVPRQFQTGVVVTAATNFADPAGVAMSPCLKGADELVFFYARGSATPGSITVYQPNIDRSLRVCVTGLTGRVARC